MQVTTHASFTEFCPVFSEKMLLEIIVNEGSTGYK